MALDRLTKIDGGGISTTSDYRVGVITATKFVGPIEGAITSTDATFTGNVSIGGTLTYEDVTNIDSVGLITARDGIFLPDGKIAKFGNTSGSADLNIYHSGSHSYIENSTNFLFIHSNSLALRSLSQETFVDCSLNGSVDLYWDNSKKFETSAKGIQVGTGVTIETNGQATYTGIVTSRGFNVPQTNDNGTTDSFIAGRIKIFDPGGQCQIQFGTGPSYAPHQKYASSMTYRTNAFTLQNTGTTRTGLSWNHGSNHASGQGSVNLYYTGDYAPNYGVKLSTHSGGINVTGVTTTRDLAVTGVSTFTGAIDVNSTSNFDDNVSFTTANGNGIIISKSSNYMMFGNSVTQYFGGSSMWLMHNGSTGYLHNSTGDLYIRDDDGDIYIQAKSGEHSIKCLNDGGVYLYYDGGIVAETTTNGFQITNGALDLNNTGGSGASLRCQSAGTFYVGAAAQGDLALYVQDNTNNSIILQANTGEKYVECNMGGSVDLYHHGTKKAYTQASGLAVNGNINLYDTYPSITWEDTNHNSDFRITNDNGKLIVYDITRGAHVLDFLANGDLHVRGDKGIYFGESNDLLIGHDGSSTRIDDNFGYLNIRSNILELKSMTGSELYANFIRNGSAKLYYDGTERFATSGIGVTVTGEVAASQDYPNFRPTLDLNFAAVKKLDTKITYERTGSASFTNEFGKVVLVGGNVPRFDHDPVTRESKGLLIEESRTNMFSGTANMAATGSRWAVGGARGSQGANIEGPDGTLTALQNVYNGTSGDLNIYYSPIGGASELTTSNDTVYTYSVWAKLSAGASYLTGCRLRTYNQNISVNYDLNNGAVFGTQENQNSDFISSSIEEYPNDWYRCIMTFRSGTDGNQGFQIYLISGTNNHALNSSGANGESVSFWGAQLEAGSFATSFIPTGNDQESVTRGADQTYIDGDDFLDFYNQTEGTMISSHSILSDEIPSNHNLYTYQIAPTGNTAYAPLRILDRNSSIANSIAVASVYNNGYSFLTLDTGNPVTVAGRKYVIAASIKKDDYDAVFNGGDLKNDSSGDLYTADHISIGYYKPSPQAYLNGHIQRLIYYPTKLTNNQLKTITS